MPAKRKPARRAIDREPDPRPAKVYVDPPPHPMPLPEPTAVPKHLLQTIMWCIGAVGLTAGAVVGVNALRDHSKAVDDAHDAQFVRNEKAEKDKAELARQIKDHEREDIVATKSLADSINSLASTADISRQYLIASNKDIKASVSELIVRQCRKDNAGAKDLAFACEKEIAAADKARKDADKQSDLAAEITRKAQVAPIQPPIAVPAK